MEERSKNKTKNLQWYAKVTTGVIFGWSFWFCLLVLSLRWINPSFTAFTLQENWDEQRQERYDLRTHWISDEQLPDHLKLAIVASEDQRFYEHWGLDLAAIDKALEEKEKEGRIRGASTISQQVAKNLFLWPAQSYFRKGIEAVITVLIELLWTKDRILEVYLNIAEFGPGMYGVETASHFYYGKSGTQLTPKESARMATVLPNPKIIEPVPPSEYVLERSQWILRNMEQLSGISYLPKPKPLPEIQTFSADSTKLKKDTLPVFDSIPEIKLSDSLMPVTLDSIRRF